MDELPEEQREAFIAHEFEGRTRDHRMSIIRTEELQKKFGEVTAVDHVGFAVERGEIFAFLGPNGAGKSTTIKMLTTLLTPTSGRMEVAGHDPRRPEAPDEHPVARRRVPGADRDNDARGRRHESRSNAHAGPPLARTRTLIYGCHLHPLAATLKRYVRSRARIVSSLGQPLLFLVALGLGFGPIYARAGGGDYIQFLAPGIIAMGSCSPRCSAGSRCSGIDSLVS